MDARARTVENKNFLLFFHSTVKQYCILTIDLKKYVKSIEENWTLINKYITTGRLKEWTAFQRFSTALNESITASAGIKCASYHAETRCGIKFIAIKLLAMFHYCDWSWTMLKSKAHKTSSPDYLNGVMGYVYWSTNFKWELSNVYIKIDSLQAQLEDHKRYI